MRSSSILADLRHGPGREELGFERFPFTPYPTGWYRLAASRDLRPADVKTIRCFGQDLVLFRTEAGDPIALDDYCPHLGASLSHGGKVIGNAIACPFHGWRLNGRGRCVAVPNGGVPNRALVKSWPIEETNAGIMVWYDPQGTDAAWPAPRLNLWDARYWTPWRPGAPRRVRTHVQELCENGIDLAHFSQVHAGQIFEAKSEKFEINGPELVHRINKKLTIFGWALYLRSLVEGSLEYRYFGLGTEVIRARVNNRLNIDFLSVIYLLPIDADTVSVKAEFSIRRRGLQTRLLKYLAIRESEEAIVQDTKILENKIYRAAPQLSSIDGPIMQYRKWAQQFYRDASGSQHI